MRVRFNCDSGANIHSCRQQEFDVKTLGYSDEEWKSLTEEEKYDECRRWADERLEIYTEDLD